MLCNDNLIVLYIGLCTAPDQSRLARWSFPAVQCADLGGGSGNAGTRPQRRPRDQNRGGRHDAAPRHPGMARKRPLPGQVLKKPARRSPLPTAVPQGMGQPLGFPIALTSFPSWARAAPGPGPDRDPRASGSRHSPQAVGAYTACLWRCLPVPDGGPAGLLCCRQIRPNNRCGWNSSS